MLPSPGASVPQAQIFRQLITASGKSLDLSSWAG